MYGSTNNNLNNNNNNNNYNYNNNNYNNNNMGYNNNINNNNNMYNNNNNNEGGYEVKYKMEESIKELRRMKITMEQMVLHLASKNDSFSHRDRLKQERAKALSFLSSLSPLLQSPSRPDLDKLKHEITQMAVEIKDIIKKSIEKEESFPLSSDSSFLFSSPQGGNDLRGMEERRQTQMIMSADLVLEEYTEQQIDNKIIQERNDQMKGINKDLQILLPITQSLAEIVGNTNEILDRTEMETSKTAKATHDNLLNIELGGKRQSAARRKCLIIWCLIIFCILVVLLIIGARVSIYAAMA